jgi:hypothetical protein
LRRRNGRKHFFLPANYLNQKHFSKIFGHGSENIKLVILTIIGRVNIHKNNFLVYLVKLLVEVVLGVVNYFTLGRNIICREVFNFLVLVISRAGCKDFFGGDYYDAGFIRRMLTVVDGANGEDVISQSETSKYNIDSSSPPPKMVNNHSNTHFPLEEITSVITKYTNSSSLVVRNIISRSFWFRSFDTKISYH